MLQRPSRSRSRTADQALPEDSASPPIDSPDSTVTPHPTSENPQSADSERGGVTQTVNGMSSSALRQTTEQPADLADATPAVGSPERDDYADDRSSSLSELEDGIDEGDDVKGLNGSRHPDMDVDSEAETERLERTPRKFGETSALTAANPVDSERTPSKLAQEVSADDLSSSPHSTIGLALRSSSRKRKRRSSEISSLSGQELDKRAPKRAYTSRSDHSELSTNALQQAEVEQADQSEDVKDEASLEEDRDNEDVGAEGKDDNDGNDDRRTATASIPSLRTGKGRKGKRKGKKAGNSDAVTDAEENSEDVHEVAEVLDEADEDDSSSLDEELAKKKAAMEALAIIEKQFMPLREKLLAEQLRRVEHELELLNARNSTHPEYLAQLSCIDERRNKKIEYEDILLGYELQALRVRTVAERGQLHSQFFQECRKIKDDIFELCYKEIYALKNDRMRHGATDTPDLLLYNPNRSEQIKRQAARNLYVSIDSGIAKYVGMPAAPELRQNTVADTDRDLRAMGIQIPATARLANTQAFIAAARPAMTDQTVDRQFLDQNPWANPQHPVAQAAYQSMQAPGAVSTPAGRRTVVDSNATNGSQSTIDASNPPSSVPRPPIEHIDSPISSNKKPPNAATFLKALSRAQDTPDRITTTHGSLSQPQNSTGASVNTTLSSGPLAAANPSSSAVEPRPFARFAASAEAAGLPHQSLPAAVGQFAS